MTREKSFEEPFGIDELFIHTIKLVGYLVFCEVVRVENRGHPIEIIEVLFGDVSVSYGIIIYGCAWNWRYRVKCWEINIDFFGLVFSGLGGKLRLSVQKNREVEEVGDVLSERAGCGR